MLNHRVSSLRAVARFLLFETHEEIICAIIPVDVDKKRGFGYLRWFINLLANLVIATQLSRHAEDPKRLLTEYGLLVFLGSSQRKYSPAIYSFPNYSAIVRSATPLVAFMEQYVTSSCNHVNTANPLGELVNMCPDI